MKTFALALLIGLVFGPLAAAAAFVITYEEYRKHFLERGPALEHALRVALVTLVLFLAITGAGVWLVARWGR